MKKLKFGIIGCGRIAGRHAKWASEYGSLVAVCDIIAERAEEIANEYSCEAFQSIDELIEKKLDIDCIAVCTPNGLHAEHSIKLLRAGYHVLSEKPMATSVQDSVEMIKVAELTNRRLFIVKQNRYNPPIAALKKAIDDGHLGRILSMQLNCFWNRRASYFSESDWKGSKVLDGGTLYTQFSHFIDLIYWLIGDVRDVRAFVSNSNHEGITEFEDQGVAILEFYSGVLGSIHFTINSCNKNMEGSITIFGDKGTVKVGGQFLNELEYQEISDFTIEGLPEGNPPNQYGTYVGSMSNHDKVYENVVDVLQGGGVIGTVGIEGLKTVEIIDKIYRAAQR
ncbi:Gfo/Idh/MocA family oxidoreductase [bacterium]|nr:Gfo/Idh/MocA family oxidoreductase [bacterium]